MESVVKFKVLDNLKGEFEPVKEVKTTTTIGHSVNEMYNESYNDGLFSGAIFGIMIAVGLGIVSKLVFDWVKEYKEEL